KEGITYEYDRIPQQIYLFKLAIISIINTIIESKHLNNIIEEKDIGRIFNFKRETISLYQFYEIQFHPYIRQLLYQVRQCLTYNNLKELIEILTNDNQQLEEKNILTFEQQIEQLNQTKKKYYQDYDIAEKQREFLRNLIQKTVNQKLYEISEEAKTEEINK
ncbi:1682_t:CDS:1, partial [Racocetra persica]